MNLSIQTYKEKCFLLGVYFFLIFPCSMIPSVKEHWHSFSIIRNYLYLWFFTPFVIKDWKIYYSISHIFLKLWKFEMPVVLVIIVVQSLSRVWLFVTPWIAACKASLSFTISLSLLKLMTIESVMPSNHLMLCHTLLLLPSIFPNIREFSSELALCIRWPKNWSFSFSFSPSNEYSGLIFFNTDWSDLLAGQRTPKSLQHHTLESFILSYSAFFIVQLAYPYRTTRKIVSFDHVNLCWQSDVSAF